MTRGLAATVIAVSIGMTVGTVVWRRTGQASTASSSPVLTRSTQQFWQAYTAARTARAAGRLDEAIAEYSHALIIRPDHEDTLYYLGHSYLERRQYAEALRAYRRLVAVSPDGSSRAYMQIALVHASLDPAAPFDLAAARTFFERALALDPDSGALLGLGEIALLERRWGAARETLLGVEADNPMSIAAPYLLGYLAWRSRDRVDAWRRFTAAVARGESKKAVVKWTEEGDVKADPTLRWRALARQSVFGEHWMRLRAYLRVPGPAEADMAREYDRLGRVIDGVGRAPTGPG